MQHCGSGCAGAGAARTKEGRQATGCTEVLECPCSFLLPMTVTLVASFLAPVSGGKEEGASQLQEAAYNNASQHLGALRIRYSTICVWPTSCGESVVFYPSPFEDPCS